MNSLSKTFIATCLALCITAAVAICLYLPFGRSLEEWMSDKMFSWRYELLGKDPLAKPDSRLVLAAIDQRSVEILGKWPFPRNVHAQFLGVLAPQKPKVVTWDVFFTEKTAPPAGQEEVPGTLQPDDVALVEGAKLIPHMITASSGDPRDGLVLQNEDLGPTKALKRVRGDLSKLTSFPRADIPIPELRKVSYFGFADADAAGLQREMPLVVNIGGQIFPSLDLETLIQFWDVDPDQVAVDLGRAIILPHHDGSITRIPISESGRMLVNYRARTSDFDLMDYADMGKDLADVANGRAPDEKLPAIEGKILMIGVTLLGTDTGATPIDSYSPLITSHLNVLNNILKQDYLRAMSPKAWLPLYLLYLFVIANAMLRVDFYRLIPIAVSALTFGVAIAFGALWFLNELMPVLVPEIGILVLTGAVPAQRFFGEEREKLRIKGAMRAYLSDKVMAKVLEHPDNLKLGGVKQEITIMFCDIRGFTAYCDERDPQETMDVLNEYMETMTQVVFKHDGTIDKYIGDCIMAFWNAPELQPDHAQKAVICAMEMRAALAEFTKKRAGTELAHFECGIGIHTGEALVGNMGSSLKRNYTAMGSTVNLASRLESLTKKLGERILISVDTFNRLQGDLPIVDRGEATVAGVGRPVHVYGVKSRADYEAILAEAEQRV